MIVCFVVGLIRIVLLVSVLFVVGYGSVSLVEYIESKLFGYKYTRMTKKDILENMLDLDELGENLYRGFAIVVLLGLAFYIICLIGSI